jgi:hypothetical protein
MLSLPLMKKLISERFAALALLGLLGALFIFHLLIVVHVLPFDIVWGGKLRAVEDMQQLEIASLVMTLVLLAAVGLRAGYLPYKPKPLILRVVMWMMVVLFVLNTLGNLLSENMVERLVFTPVTVVMALLSLRLAVWEN